MIEGTLAPPRPSSGPDLVQAHCELEEALEPALLASALRALGERHSVLSDWFSVEGVVRPADAARDPAHWVEVRARLDARLGAEDDRLEDWLREDRARGCALFRGPPLRVSVLLRGPRATDLVVTFPRVLLDDAGFAVLLRDLFREYDHHRAREGSAAPASPGSPAAKLRDARVGAAPSPLPGGDLRRTHEGGFGVSGRVCRTGRTRVLRRFSREVGCSVETLVEAALCLVVAGYTGDEDVVLGAMRGVRHWGATDEPVLQLGRYEAALPLRARLAEARTVADLLHVLGEQRRAMRPHEGLPFADVAAESDLPEGAPLFEILVACAPRDPLALLRESGDERWARARITLYEEPPVPLSISVFEDPFELRARFDRRRLRGPTVDRLLASLEHVLEALVEDPERPLTAISVVPPAERRTILFDWNATARAFPERDLIHEGFERNVDRDPSAPALVLGGRTVTYGELEARANRIAGALGAKGIGPGDRVGVCLSRGEDLVASLLAVCKTGAAYVALDPSYPRERLEFMAADAEVALVVSADGLGPWQRERSLWLDREDLASLPATRPGRRVDSTEPCYLVFTSGSTGLPKGVVLSHRAVVNTLDWVNRTFAVGPGDRSLFVTSPCFDLSVYDVFGVLAGGGAVVVASERAILDPDALGDLLLRERVTLWNSPPATLANVLATLAPRRGANERVASEASTDEASALRVVLLSGDFMPLGLPAAVRARFERAHIANLGGATEAAIWSNWFPVGEVDPSWVSVPYGTPIQNARYHVLDGHMRPVPVGTTGELYIGGVCLADGYWRRPELTLERFVPDPFGAGPGDRLYRTGDLARYFEDGRLELVGRRDSQVKLRGFRVELGEVEAALVRAAGVRQAVCALAHDASGPNSLHAYVVPEDAATFDPARAREALASALPRFMIPARIIPLSALPLSANGKVDRGALASVRAPAARLEALPDALPRTETERRLWAIWKSVLGRDRVGVRDDFFGLGGHSVLAAVLVTRISVEFGIDLPVTRLLEAPTIEGLAASIDRPESTPERRIRALRAEGDRVPLFLWPGLGGYGIAYRDLADRLGPEHPVYVLPLLGDDDLPVLPRSIEEAARLDVEEILRARPHGPLIVGGYSLGVLAALEAAHLLASNGREVPLIISIDGPAPGFPGRRSRVERAWAHLRAHLGGGAGRAGADLLEAIGRLRSRAAWRSAEPGKGASASRLELQARAGARYRPRFTLESELLLIAVEGGDLWAAPGAGDPRSAWRRFVAGAIEVVPVEGEHKTLLERGSVSAVAGAIFAHMRRA